MSDTTRWVALDLAPPGAGEMAAGRAGEREVLVCNVDGDYYALDDVCPHVQVPLRDGTLNGHLLACSLHGGCIDVRDGSPAGLPIRRPARTWPVRERDGVLEVELPA